MFDAKISVVLTRNLIMTYAVFAWDSGKSLGGIHDLIKLCETESEAMDFIWTLGSCWQRGNGSFGLVDWQVVCLDDLEVCLESGDLMYQLHEEVC